jgi:hypothetical protein
VASDSYSNLAEKGEREFFSAYREASGVKLDCITRKTDLGKPNKRELVIRLLPDKLVSECLIAIVVKCSPGLALRIGEKKR